MSSQPELTPPAMTLALDSELLESSHSASSAVTTIPFGKMKKIRPTAKLSGLTLVGGAGCLLIVALAFSLGMFDKAGKSSPSLRLASSTAAVTPASSTARVVAEAGVTQPSRDPSLTASPSLPPATGSASSTASFETIPDYVSKPGISYLTDVAIRRAQRCHPRGHAVGTAQVFITFAPNGQVSDARLEGEPLQSAPVASCILEHARSIRMAKFEGAPFTYVRSITLR